MSRLPRVPSRLPTGFTLVEIIMVIVITGIIAVVLGTIIMAPIQGYEAQSRRAELIDAAESALRLMQRDIHHALPNSVRIRTPGGVVDSVSCPANGNICVLEILHTADGGRYRASPGPGFTGAANIFNFGVAETDFDVIGTLQNLAAVDTANDWLVVNNQTTIAGNTFNAYCNSNNCNNRASLNTGITATHINLDGHTFSAALASIRQRFFIVDTPVTYLCNTTAGTNALTRYEGYGIRQDHADVDTDAELTAGAGEVVARAAGLVVGCRFSYQAGASARGGLVTLELTIEDLTSGSNEQVRLLRQLHVYNIP